MSATTFDEIRRQALRKVADAEDWLRSDWSDHPSMRQGRARVRAAKLLAEAHGALDDMAARYGEGGYR